MEAYQLLGRVSNNFFVYACAVFGRQIIFNTTLVLIRSTFVLVVPDNRKQLVALNFTKAIEL